MEGVVAGNMCALVAGESAADAGELRTETDNMHVIRLLIHLSLSHNPLSGKQYLRQSTSHAEPISVLSGSLRHSVVCHRLHYIVLFVAIVPLRCRQASYVSDPPADSVSLVVGLGVDIWLPVSGCRVQTWRCHLFTV